MAPETEESSRQVYMRAPTKRKMVPEQATAPCACDACRVDQDDAVPDFPYLSSLSARALCDIIKNAWDGGEDLRLTLSEVAVAMPSAGLEHECGLFTRAQFAQTQRTWTIPIVGPYAFNPISVVSRAPWARPPTSNVVAWQSNVICTGLIYPHSSSAATHVSGATPRLRLRGRTTEDDRDHPHLFTNQ